MSILSKHIVDLTPLRTKAIARLFVGTGFGVLGLNLFAVAAQWQMYEITKSSLMVGLLGATSLLPTLVLSVVGGALADAHDKRTLMCVYYMFEAVAIAGLWVVSIGMQPRVGFIFGTEFLVACASSMAYPAGAAAIQLLTPSSQIESVAALRGVMYSTVHLAAPALAGVLIHLVGVPSTYGAGMVVLVVGAAVLLGMPRIAPAPDADKAGAATIKEGLVFVRRKPIVMAIFGVDLNAMVFGLPQALFPAMAARIGGGSTTFGLLKAAPFVGSSIASLVSRKAANVRKQGMAVVYCVMAWGAAIALAGLTTMLPLVLFGLAAAGAADMISGIYRMAIVQASVPDEMRGRISGIEFAVYAGGPAFGDIEAGAVASLTNVGFSWVSGGVMCVGVAWFLSRRIPELRRYRAPDFDPQKGAEAAALPG